MSRLNMIDVWRVLHADEKAYTWSKPFIARRLDYCFVSDNVMQSCVSCDIVSLPNIDPIAVTLRLSTSSSVRGPGYWRFNNSYLKDPVFVDKLNNMLDYTLTEEMQIRNAQNVWDLTKVKIRDLCIDYGKKNRPQSLGIEIISPDKAGKIRKKRLSANKDDQPLHAEVLRVMQELELITIGKAKSAQIRSRIKWIEEGERNTACVFFLLNLGG